MNIQASNYKLNTYLSKSVSDYEDFFYPDKFMLVYKNMIKELSEAIANG